MIISASRRTDIPAFYAEWFMNRIRAGFCIVPNPFNSRQISRISLKPEDVDVIVFWTRSPRPLLAHLDELDARGYRYYIQYTVLGYPRALDPKTPPLEASFDTFRAFAERIGPARVVWRYDPIVFSNLTGLTFHQEQFERIAGALEGHARRCVISVMTPYRKIQKRMRTSVTLTEDDIGALAPAMRASAGAHGMTIQSCAVDLQRFGVPPGKCIDDDYIKAIFGIDVTGVKDPVQRAGCNCVASRDIGVYDTCLFGCAYCYATASPAQAKANHAAHDPHAPALVGGL
ncbi:MAG: DUF1848 domain-containing protein [Anaerolineae bacterium]|nr:DUF1848 domain-containing protein [Anaerolineae bacterium]